MSTNGICVECGGPSGALSYRLPGQASPTASPDSLTKAVSAQPDPTATPSARGINVDGPAAGYPVPGAVPNPSPELTAAAHVARGPVQRMGDGVGGSGGDLDFAGHSDQLQAAADRVATSVLQDPELSQVRSRGSDFTGSPVSPLASRPASDWRGQPINR